MALVHNLFNLSKLSLSSGLEMSGEQGVSDEAENENRIDKLEREIDRLKASVQSSSDEMKQTVEDLKKAVVDIRSAVSEIENPFNLLRVITSEKDLEKLDKAQPIIEKIQVVKEKKEKEEETREKKLEPDLEAKKSTAETLKQAEEQIAEINLEEWPPNFKHGFSLIRWIYTMFDLGFDGNILKRICQYCEYFGVIPKGSSTYISSMIDALTDAKSKGLSEEDIMLAMYMVAEALGVDVKAEKIHELAVNVLKRNRLKKLVG